MCDSIEESVWTKFKGLKDKKIDSIIHESIVSCTRDYVYEISKTRFTFPYRKINKNLFPFPDQTELLLASKYFNITNENINTGFAEQYPYEIYDSIMHDTIIKHYGYDVFKVIKRKNDSLIKVNKGLKAPQIISKKKTAYILKNLFKETAADSFKCDRADILVLKIELNGTCNIVNLLTPGPHGRTMPSSCLDLLKIIRNKESEIKKIKWKPAEFEGKPIETRISFNFYEFKIWFH